MPKPKDRVQISKQESLAGGGTDADSFDFLNEPLNPTQDAPDVAGVYFQESGVARDKVAVIYRENNELYLEDIANSGTYRLSLSDTLKVKITSADTTPRYLNTALELDGLTSTVKNPGADETLELKVDTAGTSPFTIRINPENLTTVGNNPKHVIANGYSALEFIKGATDYGAWSDIWTRTPSDDVELNVKFILRSWQVGTVVRIGAKIKCRADGEDTSTTFDEEKVDAVTINTTNIGDVFEASMLFSKEIFTVDDSVAIQIGRDGFEQISPTTPADDFNEKIQIIAINLRVP